MYVTTAFGFFLVGGIFALLIRSELAIPGVQFVDPETYNQLFTIHGTTMIFLFVMPMMDRPRRTSSCRSRSARRTWPSRASTR